MVLLINRRNGPRYQRVLALCVFFKQGQYRRDYLFENLVLTFVYVLFMQICVRTDFVCFLVFFVFLVVVVVVVLGNLWFDDLCEE